MPNTLRSRAAAHAALGDTTRLAIVDALFDSDLAAVELQARLHVASNLLAHHLDVLEAAGLIRRSRSDGDGRRRYLRLRRGALADLVPRRELTTRSVLFICTANSARSQLAAGLWQHMLDAPATSAGTHPAVAVHPGAIAAARRADLDLSRAKPRHLSDVRLRERRLVVTVCDRAHEELDRDPDWLHWSIPDPVPIASRKAFDATVEDLRERIDAFRSPDEVGS